jgi:serine/threonine protein kinase/Flp pilus assembly protein TadD
MNPERWEQIRDLLHSAMQMDPTERSAFLEQECSNDPALRQEMDNLLAAEGELPSSFLQSPALTQVAADLGSSGSGMLAPGTKLGPYAVLALIGAGGMGEVYRARDTRLDRTVAVKVIPAHLSSDPERRQRFEREARAISSLQHPNICTLHDVGSQDGMDYLVMEYLEGETLAERLEKGRLSLDLTLLYATEVADALAAAHGRGVVHRDLKPGNIFITMHGESKVLDFGLAKLEQAKLSPDIPAAILGNGRAITRPGSPMGTVAYMSPEQARGEELDGRTDIFSLGAVLYEMATGESPFPGKTSAIVFKAILDETPPAPSEVVPGLPQQLDQIVAKALKKERDLRYQSAAFLRGDLSRLKRDAESTRVTTRVQTAATRRSGILWKVIGAVAFTLVVIVLGVYHTPNGRTKLIDTDTIVLADFTNTTGDPVFDDTLKQGLTIQLEQSPFLSIVSEDRIQQTLRLMNQTADIRLTPKIAREVCQRTQSAAVLESSIAQVGTEYLLVLKAVSCAGGRTLASTEAHTNDKSQILRALNKVSAEIRNKLGESLSTVEKYDAPVEQVTTSSLEALLAYSQGRKAFLAEDFDGAVRHFRRAISLDGDFAMAYAALGTTYFDGGEQTLGAQSLTKAYELHDRVSEREKFYIEAYYHYFITGNFDKARKVCDMWAQAYPRDPMPSNRLANIYGALGRRDEALVAALQSNHLAQDTLSNANLVFNYYMLNQFGEARAVADEARKRGLDSSDLRAHLYSLAFAQNDPTGMADQLAWFASRPGGDEFLDFEADTAVYAGQLSRARELARRARASAQQQGDRETAATSQALEARREALLGNATQAKVGAEAALRLTVGRDVRYVAAMALAIAGETRKAQSITEELNRQYPEGTIVQGNFLPTLRGKLALAHKDVVKAIDLLKAATPGELGDNLIPLQPVYVRGEAYLAARRGSEAAAEFQKIMDHRQIVQNDVIGALARLGLARAYALQGNTAKARTQYQDFLTLWKDADPDVPVLKQAKAEYAKLSE